MSLHQSDEPNKVERADALARREDRIAKMRAACQSESTVACRFGCTKGCQRRSMVRKAKTGKDRTARKTAAAINEALDRKWAARDEADRLKRDAAQKNLKLSCCPQATRWKSKEVSKWRREPRALQC